MLLGLFESRLSNPLPLWEWYLNGAVLLYCRVQFDSTWLVDRSIILCIIACYTGIGSLFLALANIVCKRD